METKLKSLFHDPVYYVKAFKAYAAKSAKFQVLSSWGDNVFGDAVVEKLRVTLDDDKVLRVLGIGSGSGEMDCKMLAKLLPRFPCISNRVVEPATDQLVLYKALAESKADELRGVKFDWLQQTVDQYQSQAGDSTKYHFISAIHSIYYAKDVESSLEYLYNLLEPGGMLLVVSISDDSGFCRLWNRFSDFQDNLVRFINSAHVRRSFDQRNIPFKSYHQRSRVDITGCFEASTADSEDSHLVVDFLVHVVRFMETATKDLRKQAVEYLASPDCSDASGGSVLFNNNWNAIVVSK